MSSIEQELTTTENKDDKPDSSPQKTENPVELKTDETESKDSGDISKDKADDSQPATDAASKGCGDNNKLTPDNSSKPADLNKSLEFDDLDDDELQLRWDDDDEPVDEQISNDKQVDDSSTKDSEAVNPSTSLVTAVKELENALIETSDNNVNVAVASKDEKDSAGNKDTTETSSKKILEDIDKLIGNEKVDKAENNPNNQTSNEIVLTVAEKSTEDTVISVDSSFDLTNPISDSNYKIDVGSVSSTKESVRKENMLSENQTDTSHLNESAESLEIINESSLLSSTVNESFREDIKVEHGLQKPDMMLEIPTQELIDCMNDFDSDNEKGDEKVKSIDVSNQISSLEKDIDHRIVDSEEKTKDQEIIDDSSKLTEKDVTVDENMKKEVGSTNENIFQQSVKNISDFAEKILGHKELDNQSKIETMDQKTADNTSETNSNDQDPEKTNNNAIEQEASKNIEDSLNDVEMCDVSDRDEAMLPNTESTETEIVGNTEKLVEISPIEKKTDLTLTDESIMEVDEIKTPEKELKSVTNSEDQPKDLEANNAPASANLALHYNKINEKSEVEPKPSLSNVTEKTTKQTDKIVDMKTSEHIDSSNVLEIVPKDKDTETTADIENLDTNAATLIKSTVEEDTNLQKLNASGMMQKSATQETPVVDNNPKESLETSEKSDVKPQLENIKPVATSSVEPVPVILDQKFDIEKNHDSVNEQTVTPELEQPSLCKEINESVKEDPTTDNKAFKDETVLESKTTETTNDKPSTSKDPSHVEPTIDSIGLEKGLKDPVLDQPSKSSEATTNEKPITSSLDTVPTEIKTKDPVFAPPSTLNEPTSKEEPKGLDQPSTSTDTTPKELLNIEPEPKSQTLDSVTLESKDSVDQPSTSKLTEEQLDQIPDTTDEVPEMEDTLGLLAESSRVVDADAEEGSSEGGEAEEDEEGDDDEFDPDDESSNQMTAEHSEESNALPDKDDGQTDKEDKTPEQEKQFNFAIAAVTTAKEGDGGEMEVTTEDDKAADDVTVPTEAMPAPVVAGTKSGIVDKETPAQEEQPKDTDTVKPTDAETNAAANSILKDLLLKEAQLPPEMLGKRLKTPAEGVVDLASSSEDDEVKKRTGRKATSIDAEKEATAAPEVNSTTTTEDTPKPPEISDALPEKAAESAKKEPSTNAEVFNLDSDEDDIPSIANEIVIEDKPEANKCINPSCRSGSSTTYVVADAAARAYFDADKKKKHKVCLTCADAVAERTKGLVNGIKEFTPLLELDLRKVSSETVEISDSDSDTDETETTQPDVIGEDGAKFLEEHLADVINETWLKYKLDERLRDAQSELDKELEKLEADSKEIDTMLNECQIATDLLRNQLYATFEPERRELSAICIMDTPTEKYSFCETSLQKEQPAVMDNNRLKRKSTATIEQPAKRPAIPLGYTPLETEDHKPAVAEVSNADDDKDVSVVKLSAESAPSDLPPPGEIVRPPLRAGMSVFAMRNSFCTWLPGKIIEVQPKNPGNPFTMCRIRFEIRQKVVTRILAARCLAYLQPADVRLTIGTRVIALSQENAKADEASKKKTFYSGIVAEVPNPVNSYRYLIFFDHGYAQYVQHRDTRVVCESANLVWEEVHPNSREFVKQYLLAYPERPMVRLHKGQTLKTEWNGKWWVTKVLQVDASLVEVSFEDNRTEWIYRGSTRLAPLFLELQAAERQRSRPLPRSNQRRMNMPYVEYTRSEEQNKAEAVAAAEKARQEQQNEEMRRQRAVAKKSTALPAPPAGQPPGFDSVTSRVVYYTPKNAVKPLKMTPHTCSPKCKRSDVLALKDLRTYNPLAKPLLSGWERQIARFKGHKEVMYRAPCGRRLRNMRELHRYLRAVQSDMGVDLFDFGPNTHCLAEFVLNKCLVGKKDLSHGKENVPVPCVNYYDESLPEFCSYNTERTPTAGVPLNLDPDFLCGCDCTDDCEDKSKCACWKMTLEGARTIGLQGANVGYEYKRLPEPLPSGIYECNSRCKCKQTCLNRVAQHPLQLKLQVFKTMNRGWGIRALNDVPKGSFLCVYAGNLLTDATANLDGLNEGDEYLAELDYIEVVEQMKEGYEEDIPEADKKLDRESSKSSSEEEDPSSEEEENSNDKADDDFQPGHIGLGLTEFNKRLRKRDRTRKRDADKQKGKEIDKGMEDDGCITISDDEEAKEPTQFTAQTGIGANGFIPKYKSVRTLFGKDEACYIMDAKVQGNIGRYLNHSCTPNVFVQNVFVDTHDPRFPWVAFFALSHIRAGTELTWNYNYDVGSVPGKVLYCYCGAPNCRGRLL